MTGEETGERSRLRAVAVALFVPAGLLAAAAVYTMYRLGTGGQDNHADLARVGLVLSGISLVLVIAGAMVRDRAGNDDENDA